MTEKYRQITIEQYLGRISPSTGVDTVAGRKAEAKREQIDTVLKIVASDFDLTPDDIIGSSRRNDIARARHVAAYFLAINTDLSLKSIAIALKRTDHTTVINSLNRVQELMTTDPYFKETIESHPLSVRAA